MQPAHDLGPEGSVPRFLPDGQKIIWERGGEIYKMNKDGTNPRRVIDLPGSEHAPVWKPDGSLIAFLRQRGASWDIYVMNPNGDNVRRVTRSKVEEGSPSWHPTRNVLVYVRDLGLDKADIYKESIARGSDPIQLTSSPRNESYPAFSPNGRKIVYGRFHPDTSSDIWMMKSNGSNEHEVIATTERDFDPYWLLAE